MAVPVPKGGGSLDPTPQTRIQPLVPRAKTGPWSLPHVVAGGDSSPGRWAGRLWSLGLRFPELLPRSRLLQGSGRIPRMPPPPATLARLATAGRQERLGEGRR